MAKKQRSFNRSDFMEKIKVAGKVTYPMYSEYLSHKTNDEINSIYIELKVKRARIGKLSIVISILSFLYLTTLLITYCWKIVINDFNLIILNANEITLLFNYFSIHMVLIFGTIVLCVCMIIGKDSNIFRKILIIEQIMKNRIKID